MERIYERFMMRMQSVSTGFKRSLMDRIAWDARLIGIRGARGVGKTTLMLQYIKECLPLDGSTLYVSLDNIWFAENRLSGLASDFVKRGGKYLFLDEVHKYPDWSQEIKNLYDDYPELQVVFTGSSLLEILNARADLSRRAVVYTLQGLSYREFLELQTAVALPVISLQQILEHHLHWAAVINERLLTLQYFDAYLRQGYFPYFKEVPALYYLRLEEVINMTLEIELAFLRRVDASYVPKLKQLLQIIAESVPFIPNVSKLSNRIGLNRNTFTTYLYFLQEAHITRNVYRDATGISKLQKPDKLYLENTNFQYALAPDNTAMGHIRETFALNQLAYLHRVEYADKGDFRIDRKYTLEVGGKGKSSDQIRGLPNAWAAVDNLEFGSGNQIPLWLFGFLY